MTQNLVCGKCAEAGVVSSIKLEERTVGLATTLSVGCSCDKEHNFVVEPEKASNKSDDTNHAETYTLNEYADKDNDDADEDGAISIDGGWQKRGSGKSFTSLSGHVFAVMHRSARCAWSTQVRVRS